jgi:hypothetical protein
MSRAFVRRKIAGGEFGPEICYRMRNHCGSRHGVPLQAQRDHLLPVERQQPRALTATDQRGVREGKAKDFEQFCFNGRCRVRVLAAL